MLSRWEIEESPTKRDPHRRLLYVKGSLADVHGLIRKLGAVCGRPKKEKNNENFNFSLALRKLSDEELSEIEAELRSISPDGGASSAASSETSASVESVPADGGGDGGGLPIEIAVASGNAPVPIEETPMASAAPFAAPEPALSPAPAPAAESPAADEAQATIGEPIGGLSLSAPGGAAAVPTVPNPNAEIPADATPAVMDLNAAPSPDAPFAGQGPPIAARSAELGGASPSTPEPVALAGAGAPPGGGDGPSGHERLAAMPLFGGQTEPDSSRTLDNFVVGGFNRFAHAGAMSILTSPGTLYQPLFVSGPVGSGKTHLLHSLADKLQQQNPDEPVWITSGARLARAAAWALSTNRFNEMEEFAQKARALVVDDLQFMGIADHNRVQLAALFKIFTDGQKQIVLSSAYPPAMVAAIEQALEIRITAGHAVELKAPSGEKRGAIVKSSLERCGLIGEEAEVEEFVKNAVADFSAFPLTLRRGLILQGLRAAGGQPVGLADLHGALFQPDAGEPQVIAADELEPKLRETPSPVGGSRRLVLLFPHGQEVHAEWVLRQVAAAAQFQAWAWPFSDAVRKPYSVDPAATVPFYLAEEAYQAGADAVLVLGPQPGADLAEHEGDCRYVLQHLLSDGQVALGWVPYRRVHDPKYHLHAFLDLQPEPTPGGAA